MFNVFTVNYVIDSFLLNYYDFNYAYTLQAEQDIRHDLKYDDDLKKEMQIMKNVPGWEAGKNVYSKRWMPPTPGLVELNDVTDAGAFVNANKDK